MKLHFRYVPQVMLLQFLESLPAQVSPSSALFLPDGGGLSPLCGLLPPASPEVPWGQDPTFSPGHSCASSLRPCRC